MADFPLKNVRKTKLTYSTSSILIILAMSVTFNIIQELLWCLNSQTQFLSKPVQRLQKPFTIVSLGLFFKLVFSESTSEGCRPHMKSRASGEREKKEEGYLETKPIHHTSGQSAKRQLPQHLQSRQETVVGRLKERGRRKEKSNDEKR